MLQDLRHSAADEAHLVHEDMKTHPLDSALLLALRFLLGAGHPRRFWMATASIPTILNPVE